MKELQDQDSEAKYCDGVPVAAIAARLSMVTSTALRRVNRAIELGYLVNEETRKGRPKRIKPNGELPIKASVLPDAETLEAEIKRPPSAGLPTISINGIKTEGGNHGNH